MKSKENDIQFKVGDIVCYKATVEGFIGTHEHSPLDSYPMEVIEVRSDNEWSNRVGSCGGSNKYLVEYCFARNAKQRYTLQVYQNELTLWETRKEEILEGFTKYLEDIRSL